MSTKLYSGQYLLRSCKQRNEKLNQLRRNKFRHPSTPIHNNQQNAKKLISMRLPLQYGVHYSSRPSSGQSAVTSNVGFLYYLAHANPSQNYSTNKSSIITFRAIFITPLPTPTTRRVDVLETKVDACSRIRIRGKVVSNANLPRQSCVFGI